MAIDDEVAVLEQDGVQRVGDFGNSRGDAKDRPQRRGEGASSPRVAMRAAPTWRPSGCRAPSEHRRPGSDCRAPDWPRPAPRERADAVRLPLGHVRRAPRCNPTCSRSSPQRRWGPLSLPDATWRCAPTSQSPGRRRPRGTDPSPERALPDLREAARAWAPAARPAARWSV